MSSRKSPLQHASDTKVGKVEIGQDGFPWIVKETSNGTHRWVKHDGYQIHDNGGRPFLVKVGKDLVEVFQINQELTNELFPVFVHDKLIKTFSNFEKVFIGKSAEHGKRFDGNSILIKMDTHKYIFIGREIYSFTTKDEILKYRSDVGNSDVPYPFAVGTKNTYFVIEDTYLPNEMIPEDDLDDPYNFFYSYDDRKKTKVYEKNFPMKKKVLVSRLR